jgi:hypothetical protein
LGRLLAVLSIFIGTAIVGFDPNPFDPTRVNRVILVLPGEHGIHLHDVLGTGLVTLGTVVLWRSHRSD